MDEIITRQYFDETGSTKYNQVLLPKHLVSELLKSLHGQANKHHEYPKRSYNLDKSIIIRASQNSVKNGSKDVKPA